MESQVWGVLLFVGVIWVLLLWRYAVQIVNVGRQMNACGLARESRRTVLTSLIFALVMFVALFGLSTIYSIRGVPSGLLRPMVMILGPLVAFSLQLESVKALLRSKDHASEASSSVRPEKQGDGLGWNRPQPGLPQSIVVITIILVTAFAAGMLGKYIAGLVPPNFPGYHGIPVPHPIVSPGEPYNTAIAPVPNGTIVLLKKGNTYGAFVPYNQQPSIGVLPGRSLPPPTPFRLAKPPKPLRLEYAWYYRSDGKGTFRGAERGRFDSGYAKKPKQKELPPWYLIGFGPFSVGWEGVAEGYGWLYYPRFSNQKVMPGDQLMCVTKETDISKINATDPKWIYKGSPTDLGIHADGSKVKGP
jgi:hypothetical protein